LESVLQGRHGRMVVIQQSNTNCDVIGRVVETECDWLGNPGRVLVWSHDPVCTVERFKC